MNRCLILIVFKYMCVFTDKFLSLAAKKEKKKGFPCVNDGDTDCKEFQT